MLASLRAGPDLGFLFLRNSARETNHNNLRISDLKTDGQPLKTNTADIRPKLIKYEADMQTSISYSDFKAWGNASPLPFSLATGLLLPLTGVVFNLQVVPDRWLDRLQDLSRRHYIRDSESLASAAARAPILHN